MTGSQDQPQPTDLSTGERLKTTLGAVAQGIRYTLKGQHQTEGKAELTVELADVEQIIAGWPQAQQNVARQMLAKYGPPPTRPSPPGCSGTPTHPWKRTELTSDAVVHHWPAPHTDFLTQYPNYRVPPELTHLVAMFDGSILVDRTRGEVAARCDSEAANVLGMNMVHELVTGKRSVEEARHTSEQSTVAYNLGREAPMPSGCCSRCRRAAPKTWTRATCRGRYSSRPWASSRMPSPRGDGEEATDRRTPS
jgi:hypothetical protein